MIRRRDLRFFFFSFFFVMVKIPPCILLSLFFSGYLDYMRVFFFYSNIFSYRKSLKLLGYKNVIVTW